MYCLTCHVDNVIYVSGNRLKNFTIIVGPHNGKYKTCGSARNNMITGETTAYTCDANAQGNSLKIQINGRKEYLTLCEVLIFGTGLGLIFLLSRYVD